MEVLKKRSRPFLLTFFLFGSVFFLPGCENPADVIIDWLADSGVEQPYGSDPDSEETTPPEKSVLEDLKPANTSNAGNSSDSATATDVTEGQQPPLLNLSFNPETTTNTEQQYWVNESDLVLDLKTRQSAEWSVEVLQAKTLGTIDPPVQPAEGAKVTVELKDPNDSQTLTGTVGADGWVKWNTAFPKVNTFMYLVDIEGNVPWAAEDQAFWQDKSILSYTGAETGE